MAQLIQQSVNSRRNTASSSVALRIDMTPMVDLGFLLITFFVFTTALSEPSTTTLYLPKGEESGTLGKSTALTLLLSGDDKIFYYSGKWSEALKEKTIGVSSYHLQTGIGKIVRERQAALGSRRDELMLLIKPLDASSYKNFVDALDETMINSVKKYAVIEATAQEKKYALP